MSASSSSPALTADSTRTHRRQVDAAASFLQTEIEAVPSIGLILEPEIGLPQDDFVRHDQWSFENLPNAPDRAGSSVSFGRLGSSSLLTLEGALSLHEGFTPREVVFPVRMLVEAGVEILVFVQTAGSVDPVIEPGSLVLVADHVNFQGVNPLVGPNVDAWGPRFPDMTEPYDAVLRRTAEAGALRNGINLHEGIYFSVLGPNAPTPAECRMMQSLGANLVGTGTVPEVIAARHMGARVLALSVVTRQHLNASEPEKTEGAAASSELPPLLQALVGDLDDAEAKA